MNAPLYTPNLQSNIQQALDNLYVWLNDAHSQNVDTQTKELDHCLDSWDNTERKKQETK